MSLVTWPVEITHINAFPVRLPVIRVQVSYKVHLWVYLSYICNPKRPVMLRLSIQCSTHSSIRHYSEVISWLGIIHTPIGLTLIITVSSWSQLDIGRLGKRGFKLIGIASFDWNHPTVLLFTVSHLLYICQHFLCSLLYCSYSNSDTSFAVTH